MEVFDILVLQILVGFHFVFTHFEFEFVINSIWSLANFDFTKFMNIKIMIIVILLFYSYDINIYMTLLLYRNSTAEWWPEGCSIDTESPVVSTATVQRNEYFIHLCISKIDTSKAQHFSYQS